MEKCIYTLREVGSAHAFHCGLFTAARGNGEPLEETWPSPSSLWDIATPNLLPTTLRRDFFTSLKQRYVSEKGGVPSSTAGVTLPRTTGVRQSIQFTLLEMSAQVLCKQTQEPLVSGTETFPAFVSSCRANQRAHWELPPAVAAF